MAARAGASRWGMSVDSKTVKKIASLARIAMTDAEVEAMVPEFNGILGWVEQLGEVDVTGVEPMTAVIPNTLRLREDVVTDGNIRDKVLVNAPGIPVVVLTGFGDEATAVQAVDNALLPQGHRLHLARAGQTAHYHVAGMGDGPW